MLYALAQ
jgi:phenylalanyl-tRNA synthetase alpha chain